MNLFKKGERIVLSFQVVSLIVIISGMKNKELNIVWKTWGKTPHNGEKNK